MTTLKLILIIIATVFIAALIGAFLYFTSDPDGDGLSTLDELNRGTDPFNRDTDGDKLWDGDEVLKYGTNPLEKDSDHDGLSDLDEVTIYLTNPLKQDTDGDNLTDGVEVTEIHSNPLTYDSDNDGLTDYDEVEKYRTSPVLNDTDSDRLSDYLEIMELGTDPLKNDSDSDGLDDYTEYYVVQSDPLNNDTDGDGYIDGVDLFPLYDAEILINISEWKELFPGDGDDPGDPYIVLEFSILYDSKVERYNVTLGPWFNTSTLSNITYIFNVPDDLGKIYITVAVYDNDTVDGRSYDQIYDICVDREFSRVPFYMLNIEYELLSNNTLNKVVIEENGLDDGREAGYAIDAYIKVVIETIPSR